MVSREDLQRLSLDDRLGVCPTCGKPLVVLDPEKIANDLLEGFNNGLSGDELLKFARRSLTHNAALTGAAEKQTGNGAE